MVLVSSCQRGSANGEGLRCLAEIEGLEIDVETKCGPDEAACMSLNGETMSGASIVNATLPVLEASSLH